MIIHKTEIIYHKNILFSEIILLFFLNNEGIMKLYLFYRRRKRR